MAHDEARLGGGARKKQQRRVAAVGAQGEQAAASQDLGDALEGAVRALRRGDPTVEGLVRRIQKNWLALAQRQIDWLPTELKSGARVVLTAGGDVGRFVVPAYQAGLRAVTLRPETTVDQLTLLIKCLAALEEGKLHPPAFGRLLWRGELLGLDLVVVESLLELGEALVRDIAQADLWADRSARLVDVWGQLAARAEGLPEAERAARFGAPLAELRARVQDGTLELSDDEVRGLMEVADHAPGWAAAEISLLLRHPSARANVTADQLAYVLATFVEHAPRIDEMLLAMLATLGLDVRVPPPGGLQSVLCVTLGPAFARRLLASTEIMPESWAALDALSRELRAAIFGGLCLAGETRGTGSTVLHVLCRRYGAGELLAAIDPLQIGPVMAAGSVRAALGSGAEPAALLKLIERMDAQSAFAALAAGPSLCAHAAGVVAQLLVNDASAVRHLPQLVRAGVEGATCAGTALHGALGRGAELTELDETMVAFVSAGQGRNVVLPIWQRRALRPLVRRSALLALQADQRLFSDAMHFADSGDEPAELRELLEELRWQEPTS